MDDLGFAANLDYVLLWVFFCKIINVNHFCIVLLYCYISNFILLQSLLVPYPYVSIESIDYILLSSFELKAIFLLSYSYYNLISILKSNLITILLLIKLKF